MLLVAAAIITRESSEILIARRPEGSNLAGKWECPGGKVEKGEDPRAALARECREELDCEVEVGDIYETIFHSDEKTDLLLLFYLTRVVSGTLRAVEHSAIAWATPQQMADYDIIEADRPMIRRFMTDFPHFRNHGSTDSNVRQ